MFYLICYDVIDDSRRLKISKVLESCAVRVQKSVFEAVLDDKQCEELQKKLRRLLNIREDQLRFYPISTRCRCGVKILGVQPEFAVDDSAFIVCSSPGGGA